MVMARPLRVQDAGLWYHVTNRGNNRENVFVDGGDCQCFLSVLGSREMRDGLDAGTAASTIIRAVRCRMNGPAKAGTPNPP